MGFMNYQQHFTEAVTKHLTQLKGYLDEDIGRIDRLLPVVVLSQADLYIERVAGLVNSYAEMFRPDVRRVRSGGTTKGNYQRMKAIREYDQKIEVALPAMLEKQGYLTATLVQEHTGIEAAEAAKRLSKLARKHEWKVRLDPKDSGEYRYTPQRQGRRGSESGAEAPRG
jgi:hypothetical protein